MECQEVKILWCEFEKYVKSKFQVQEIEMTPRNIIFNSIVKGKTNVVNFLCLVVKQYIYAQRCLGQNLNFPVLKFRLQKVQNIERYIACKNNKMGLHLKKWASSRL